MRVAFDHGKAEIFHDTSVLLIVREAFTTAAAFLAFAYETNIDKALVGFIAGFLVVAGVLKFAYPTLARWLALGSVPARRLVSESSFAPAHGRLTPACLRMSCSAFSLITTRLSRATIFTIIRRPGG